MKLSRIVFFTAICIGVFSSLAYCKTSDGYVARDGLPNLFAKLSAGQDVTVAYFGGSITAQSGYRSQTFEWFRQTWPDVEFTQVDAAIGGTGSSLGAFRLYNDVLSKEPDLVFVEFAVNDYGASCSSIDNVVGSVEGIVRQVIRHNPNTDICLVYTITEKMIDDKKTGKRLPSIIAHEKVASHYGLPSINMGLSVERLLKADKLVIKGKEGKLEAVSGDSLNVKIDVPVNDKGQIVFSKDGVHPYNNSGHKIYTDTVVKALPLFKSAAKPAAHKLPAAINDANMENAKMVPLSDVELNGDWSLYDWDSSLLSLGIKKKMPNLMFTKKIGSSISFKFSGTVAGFYDIMGPSAGVIECSIDGKQSYASRFDKYCTYYRMSSRTLKSDEGVHEVEFTLTDRDIDKAALLKQRGSTIDNPARYENKAWYVGNVMLIGSLIVE